MVRIAVSLLLLTLLAVGPAAGDSQDSQPSWSTVVKDGVHWLVTPEGGPFYSKGVNIVDSGKESPKSRQKQAYWWRNFFPSLERWHSTVGSQLRNWGFNTRGGWSDPSPNLDLALTVDLELGRQSRFHWFDPFDPKMDQETLRWAEKLTAPYKNDPRLIGYFSDNEVGWWNSPLFQWYLSKGWENHTKRMLWQLIHDHYGGSWDRLLEDWVPEGRVAGFDDLKEEGVVFKLRQGGRGIHLVNRFMHLCAGHYYSLMARAIRQTHPGALILGDRLPLYYHQDAVRAMGDHLDVISTNYNVDAPDGWVAPYYFDGLSKLSDKPVLVTEFFFAAEENRSGNRNETARSAHPKPGHLMTVMTQAERARGADQAARNFARFPNVVGAHWFQYADEPLGGREDGEDYNMGLIDTANRPYEEVTEVFERVNSQLEALHHADTGMREEGVVPVAIQRSGQPVYAMRRAVRPINVTDQSLMDWDKAETRLPDLEAVEPYVPFGDIHLAWAPEGLYLAGIANTYMDPRFLAYQGEFPLDEAFQLHLTVETGGALKHFVVYLQPRDNPRAPDGFDIVPRLYRSENSKPAESLPVQGHVQRLNKSLPHMVLEAFIPAEWLGSGRLQPGTELRMDIAVVSTYREMTMTWSGKTNLEELGESQPLRAVVLHNLARERLSASTHEPPPAQRN